MSARGGANAWNSHAEVQGVASWRVDARARTESRVMFSLLCAYVFAQVMAIPILLVGPWALWPRIADLIVIAMLGLWLVEVIRGRTELVMCEPVVKAVVIILMLTTLSFLTVTLLGEHLNIVDRRVPEALHHGAYGLAKMAEFTVLMLSVSTIRLDRERLSVVGRVAAVSVVIMSISFAVTFFEIVSTRTIGFWLPQSEEGTGAWFAYVAGHNDGQGIGAAGYNRGHTAIQLLVMAGIALQLLGREAWRWRLTVCITGAAGLILTGSRSAMVSLIVFVLLALWFEYKRSRPLLLIGMLGFVLLSTVALAGGLPKSGIPLVDRYLTIFELSDGYEDGRLMIWQDRMAELLDGGPLVWLVGKGFGTAGGTGSNAHMLYLQVVYDLGLVGLLIVGTMFYLLIRELMRGASPNIMAWITVSLLAGAVTQETFYPVAAFGDFLGFFLIAVVLTLAHNAVGFRSGERVTRTVEGGV